MRGTVDESALGRPGISNTVLVFGKSLHQYAQLRTGRGEELLANRKPIIQR